MYVERLLQINIAALACLASLLLGMGQRSTAIPLGMLVAAMVAVWVTDFKGWFRLNKTVADWAALGALAVCLPGALRLDKMAIVSAVAMFLVLLQVIHLFRRKDAAVYWQLVRFSVLQIVVAALLTFAAYIPNCTELAVFVAEKPMPVIVAVDPGLCCAG